MRVSLLFLLALLIHTNIVSAQGNDTTSWFEFEMEAPSEDVTMNGITLTCDEPQTAPGLHGNLEDLKTWRLDNSGETLRVPPPLDFDVDRLAVVAASLDWFEQQQIIQLLSLLMMGFLCLLLLFIRIRFPSRDHLILTHRNKPFAHPVE